MAAATDVTPRTTALLAGPSRSTATTAAAASCVMLLVAAECKDGHKVEAMPQQNIALFAGWIEGIERMVLKKRKKGFVCVV